MKSIVIAMKSIVIAATIFYSDVAFAQSFNCNNAKLPDEILICKDEQLGAMDIEISETYFEFTSEATNEQKTKMQNSRKFWLHERNNCARNKQCIMLTMKAWAADMQRIGQ